jgi:hypothetical protein
MANKLRIHFSIALYHCINRGNQHKPLYLLDYDLSIDARHFGPHSHQVWRTDPQSLAHAQPFSHLDPSTGCSTQYHT